MSRRESKASSIIGLSLGDSDTQAVELSLKGVQPSVHALAEWRGGTQVEPVLTMQRLAAFIEANGGSATRIAVTVDTAALFTHVLPVPAGQSDALLLKHARWDLAQFFPGVQDTDFITDVHLLAAPAVNGTARALSVAIRRDLARSIRIALENEGLTLHALDGDHFSAEHFLTSRHPGGGTGDILLIGLKSDRMEISVLHEGSLVEYAAWNECTPESCISRLTGTREAHPQVREAYVYGPRATPSFVASLRSPAFADIQVLNPFAVMNVAPGNPLANHFLTMPHRFVPAIGAALREE